MAVYLSPGVFPREIDLSAVPSSGSGIIPAFVGTAQKGPVNEPTLVTSAAQYIDTFGDPFEDSNLGYAVLSYMEEGNMAWILRVGVECEEGLTDTLAAICIDVSGARVDGWGRVPLFTGIDFGKLRLRTPSTDTPFTFHADSISDESYNDIDVSSTDGPTTASIAVSGSYKDAIDDAFTVLVTSPPTSGVLDGAEYTVTRQSDGEVLETGTLNDAGGGNSDPVTVGETGLSFVITVTGGSPIEQDDTFTWTVAPDNRNFNFAVEGVNGASLAMSATSYTTAADFVAAFNAIATAEDYEAIEVGDELWVRTKVAGQRIQLVDVTADTEPNTEGWALEVGTTVWRYDIPRSHLVGDDTGPVAITTQRDRVEIRVIGSEASVDVAFSVPVALSTPITTLATYVDNGGIVSGTRYFDAFALQTSATEYKLAIATTVNNQFDQLKMLADYSHIETLRFAEELQIPYPYSLGYRGFTDPRVEEPAAGVYDDAIPLSCEDNPSSAECSEDTAYFQNLVGFVVAKSPGTWIDRYTFTLDNYNSEAGRYTILIKDLNNIVRDRIDDVSFDSTATRYIGNVVNAGSSIGGQNGDAYYEWVARSSNIGATEVRLPGLLNDQAFTGGANGIPADASESSALDAAIVGNPQLSSGLYAFDNPEKIDISLLCVPGNSSGAVIGRGLSVCESSRGGDCLFIVDPPFGLKPQQVVDWHNGMLTSDMTSAINSSYGALYWGWLKIFDQFTQQEIYVPPSGHVTAVFARTERERESWFAPAGLNRGRLLTALDVEYSPTKGERDLLYGLNNAVNPITKFPQEGIVIWGQRTLQRADTALDRVNVRMLLIHLKKVLIPLLRNFLFEQNDEFLWAQVRGSINPVLSDIAGRRGLTAFKTICDETNNTPATIDRNELHVTILVKPTKVVEFIQLDLAILRSDQLFSSEAVLRAAGVTGI